MHPIIKNAVAPTTSFRLRITYGPVKGAVNHWVTGSSPVGGAIH